MFKGTFSLRNVLNVAAFDRSTGFEVFTSKFVKTGNLEQLQDMDYAQGGKGNTKLAVFDSNKAMNMPIELALFTSSLMAEQMGSQSTGDSNIITRETLIVDASNQITLSYTPVAGEALTVKNALCESTMQIYAEGDPGTEVDEYSITDKVLLFNVAVVLGTKIEVVYTTLAEANAVKFISEADQFPGIYKFVIDVEVADVVTDSPYFGQIVIERGKLSGAFTIDFQNESDVAVQNANVEALTDPCNDELWSLVIYQLSDLNTA